MVFFSCSRPFLSSQSNTGKYVFPVLHWILSDIFQLQLLSQFSSYPSPVTIQIQFLSKSSYYKNPVTFKLYLESKASYYPLESLFDFRYYPILATIQSHFQSLTSSKYHLISIIIQFQLISNPSYYSISAMFPIPVIHLIPMFPILAIFQMPVIPATTARGQVTSLDVIFQISTYLKKGL